MSELVDELEAVGVVKRTPDPDDARARLVVFTPRGLEGLLRGLGVLHELERELSGAVGKRTIRNLHDALVRILAVIDGRAAGQARDPG